jgi:rifampicin phosphotransferase
MVSISERLIPYETPIQRIDPGEVGGKGWNLYRLLNFGFLIPRWLVVSSSVFEEVIGGSEKSIHHALTAVDFTDQQSVRQASTQISDLIVHSELGGEYLEDLPFRLEAIFGQEALFSVRSSVVGEDSGENSFAGQMDSFLNVQSAKMAEAIKKVWASTFSSRALLYRHRKNLSLMNASAAVIVQEMVQPFASGILFTRDPESRAKQCLISAGYGLGEGVVADRVETDTYRIRWDSDEISQHISLKDYRIVLEPTGRGGNQIEPVPAGMNLQSVLTGTQIYRLRDIGIRAENCFGIPQDIEWAYDGTGRLFILQARPIVFAPEEGPSAHLRIWDNSNIVESYPGITLPLTFSFIRQGYEIGFRNAALGFLVFKNAFRKHLHIFKNMIGLLEGRVYYNLLNWYEMLSYLPGFQRHRASWDQMIGIRRKMDFPQNNLSPLYRFLTLMMVVWRLLTVRKNAKKFFTDFNAAYGDLKDLPIAGATEDELIRLYESLGLRFKGKWHLTLYNDFCAMKYYDWLKRLCGKWGLDRYPNLHNNLLCGERNIESVEPLHSMIRIAEMFRTQANYQVLLHEEEDHEIWERIQSEAAYGELKAAFEAHLEAFGDRGLEELKLETPTFREDPASLVRLVKRYYPMRLSVEALKKREQAIRKSAEQQVRQHIKNPLKRWVFAFVLRNARLAIVNRENMRFARARLYGMVRRLFRRMAEIFVQKGVLGLNSDIYYLTVDEIFDFVQGAAVTKDLTGLVNLRKVEYAEFLRRAPGERIETRGIPYLNDLSEAETRDESGKVLKGIGCSSGIAEGSALVVLDPHGVNGKKDQILVTRSTDPGWIFLIISAKGLVVERGSVLSHTAIIGRELGIPTIVGAREATKRIPNGTQMSMNGSTGEVQWQ